MWCLSAACISECISGWLPFEKLWSTCVWIDCSGCYSYITVIFCSWSVSYKLFIFVFPTEIYLYEYTKDTSYAQHLCLAADFLAHVAALCFSHFNVSNGLVWFKPTSSVLPLASCHWTMKQVLHVCHTSKWNIIFLSTSNSSLITK